MDREEVIRRLKEIKPRLKERLKKLKHVYLVGSYASGEWINKLSDIDVIVVAEDFEGVKLVYRIRKISDLFDFEARVDLIPLTPKEFEQALKEPSIIREMMKKAVEI